MGARDLTAKVSEKGKTKTWKAEDSILEKAETSAYSVLGALLDKIPDVSHVPIDREASTLFNRRATDEKKFYPSIASVASKKVMDNMPLSSC